MPDQKKKSLYKNFHNAKGFSLIEVIVASMILFAAIVIGSGLFRTSALTLNKVTKTIAISDVLPDIMELVKEGLFEGKFIGSGQFGSEYSYEYRSEKKEIAKNLISEHGFATGGFQYGSFEITLIKVNLDIKYGNYEAKTISFDYDELIWSKKRG